MATHPSPRPAAVSPGASGTSYELSAPMRLTVPADAAAGSRARLLGSWFTPADFKELIGVAPELGEDVLGPKGTGAAARLRPLPARSAVQRAAAAQVDTRPENNALLTEFVVGGSRRPDLAAVGATVAGEVGDKVRTRVGFTNNGPGTLHHGIFDNTDPGTRVTVPPGVQAVGVDERCFPLFSDEDGESGDSPEDVVTGAPEYLCMLTDGATKAKSSTLFDFTFQVRDKPSGKAGRVTINGEGRSDADRIDRDGRNDTATIAVRFGGSGGGLPVTGANAGLLGAGGAVLLLAGAAGLLLVRRRRVRFAA